MTDQTTTTSTSRPAVLGSYEEAIEVARALKPRLRERVAEAEQLRRLPDATVADLLSSGLYGLMKPKRFGGSELGPEAMIDVTIELASACPASGWVYMLWTAHMWMQALWPEAAQEEMWNDPNTLASSVVNTTGDVVAVDGGYAWTGKGLFSSGVDHCQWLTAAVPIKGRSDGPGERRWLLIPREDFEIIDDWHTIGLRGTGSKTIVLDNVFIPAERTLNAKDVEEGRAPGVSLNTNPMYGGISSANFTAAMAAPAIGVAVGFVEEFEGRLRSKVPNAATAGPAINAPMYGGGSQSTTMARYAAAAAKIDSVHALTLKDTERYARVPSMQVGVVDRARCRRNQAFTAQSARQAVNTLFEECGGGGLSESSILQRFWRDANAAAAHHGLTWDWQGDAWTKSLIDWPTVG